MVTVDDPVVDAWSAFVEDELQQFEVSGAVEAEVTGLDDRCRPDGHGGVQGLLEGNVLAVEVADEGDAVSRSGVAFVGRV